MGAGASCPPEEKLNQRIAFRAYNTLAKTDAISAYEARLASEKPWLVPAAA